MNSDALLDCIQESIHDIKATIVHQLKSTIVPASQPCIEDARPDTAVTTTAPAKGSGKSESSSSCRSKGRTNKNIPARKVEGGACASDAPVNRTSSCTVVEKQEPDIADEFCCPICHGLLFRPIRCPCKHIFCRFCLILWVEKCVKGYQIGVCPMCREPINHPETFAVDLEMEKRIIADVGLVSYQLRHRDMVKEKIQRLVVDLEAEHRDEIEEGFNTTLQVGARAGILGTAFAGPVGAVAALGFVGAYAIYVQVMRLKREDRRKYGMIEDDASAWLSSPKDAIRLTNLTLTRVNVQLYDQESMFPLEVRTFEPRETAFFYPLQLASYSETANVAYYLQIILPGFVEKELASMPAALNHGYLFCCTDVCVEEVGLVDERKYRNTRGVIELKNESPVRVKCTFYSGYFFSDDTVIMEPEEMEVVVLPDNITHTTVQVSVASDSFFTADTELCSVQMRERYKYRILESRIQTEEVREEELINEDNASLGAPFLPGSE
eukprot:GEMP01002293.1.p1 GENE.GEMP01002293.1~~GEMP01002293.1.p1  ORF type:complete len:495 (+),score=100.28 GEMP01002293.1:127-1611(+)